MAAAAQLEDVPNESLFSELLRRMKCAPKPEKRIILVGTSRFLPRALCLFAPVLLLLLLFDDPAFLGQLVLRTAQQNPTPLICRIVMMCVYVSSSFGGDEQCVS
jgi:hypothetical protein